MQTQLTIVAASSPKTTSTEQLSDVARPQVGSLEETRAITLQPTSNDFPVRVTSAPSDYIGPSIQIVVAILTATASALVIIWQMRKQKTLADDQHRLSVKADLRLDAYRDFQIILRNVNDSNSVSTQILLIRSAFVGAIEQSKNTNSQTPLLQRTPSFMDAMSKHINNSIALIFFLERYESLLPGFEVYKLALNSALHDINKAYSLLFPVLMKWLPIDNPNFNNYGGAGLPPFLHLPIITDEALGEFNQAVVPIEKALGQLCCWTSDLAVDLQNYLLGDYADKQVKKREPIDTDTYFTISVVPDKSVGLARYFNEETEWGRNQTQVRQEVTASMMGKA